MKVVRIYPPNPSRGHFAETYILSGSGYPKFEAKRGWYQVDDKTAERMERLRNNPADSGSRPVFQVCSPAEAKAMEKVEIEQVAKAAAPIPLPKKVKNKLDPVAEEESWDDLQKAEEAPANPGYIETADEADMAELDALANEEESKAPAPAKKKVAKKKASKKKRRVAKKTSK